MFKFAPLGLATLAMFAIATPAAAQDSRLAAAFDGADTNGDGLISRAEFSASRLTRFNKMDRNGDGAISRADLPRMKRAAEKLGPLIDMTVRQSDADHDGKASRTEMANGPMPIFDRADANQDGSVDKNELAAIREMLGKMGGSR